MKRQLAITAFAAISSIICIAALPEGAHPWLNIYHSDRQFQSYKLSEIDSIIHPIIEGEEIPSILEVYRPGEIVDRISMNALDRCQIGTNVPTIYINLTEHPEWPELKAKEDYLSATIRIDGNGKREDFAETAVNIKGRGNSTWSFPKKPYRLKFDKKQKIFGMKKAKSFALIANYIDETLLCNAIALELSRMLEVSFCNSWYPVRIVFNGINKGAYFITEKIGIGGGSVDIDEDNGVLFELDSYFDEDYKFRDTNYNLPVNIKDPDLSELAAKLGTSPEDLLTHWQDVFNNITSSIKERKNLGKVIDMDDLCKFVLVNLVAHNLEIRWPRSTYVHMYNSDDKLHFGPTWDFDWAFGYNSKGGNRYCDQPFVRVNLNEKNKYGNDFFKDIVMTKEFEDNFRELWNEFYETHYPRLIEFIDAAAEEIEVSAKENGLLWSIHDTGKSSYETETNVPEIKNWIIRRVESINKHPHLMLHDGKTEDIFIYDETDNEDDNTVAEDEDLENGGIDNNVDNPDTEENNPGMVEEDPDNNQIYEGIPDIDEDDTQASNNETY